MQFKLKSNGYSKEYWNGFRWVVFDRNGFYETNDEAEAKTLLNCFGVELVEEQPAEVPTEPATKKAAGKKAKKDEQPEPVSDSQSPELAKEGEAAQDSSPEPLPAGETDPEQSKPLEEKTPESF